MTTIYIDFETFYSQSYSIKKMSTEAYIRDPQFKAHGVSVAINDKEPYWVPHQYIQQDLEAWIDAHPDAEWIAHNAQFDMAILAWHYDIHPAVIRDTLSMARIADYHGKHSLDVLSRQYNLGEKGDALIKTLGVEHLDPLLEQQLAAYCVQDVELLRRLYKRLSADLQDTLGQVRYARELALIDLTVRMFTEPVLEVNADLLRDRLPELEAERAAALQSAGVDESVLMSNQQFGALLAAQGVDVPATFRKTDSDFLELRDDPRVGHLVRGRLAARSMTELTRCKTFLDIGSRGLFPVALRYHGAHPGRWSGTGNEKSEGQNAQNLNRGSVLRRCLQAPEGHVLVVVDSSQIEARVLAWLAGEAELLQQFADGEDVYVKFAERIWPDQQIDATRRFVGKTCILGLGYGVGHVKLHAQVVVKQPEATLDDAAGYVSVYRSTYTGIRNLWRTADRMIRAMMAGERIDWPQGIVTAFEKIRLPSGRWLHYPDLRLTGEGFEYGAKERLYGAKLVENIVQAIARDIVADQMLVIAQKYRIATMTHDEIVFLAREDEAQDAFGFAQNVMRAAPKYAAGLPLSSSGGWAREYSK